MTTLTNENVKEEEDVVVADDVVDNSSSKSVSASSSTVAPPVYEFEDYVESVILFHPPTEEFIYSRDTAHHTTALGKLPVTEQRQLRRESFDFVSRKNTLIVNNHEQGQNMSGSSATVETAMSPEVFRESECGLDCWNDGHPLKMKWRNVKSLATHVLECLPNRILMKQVPDSMVDAMLKKKNATTTTTTTTTNEQDNDNDNNEEEDSADKVKTETLVCFRTLGVFCSWECMHCYDRSFFGGSHTGIIRLYRLHCDGVSIDFPIVPTPHPQAMLQKYGGKMTIEQFRSKYTNLDEFIERNNITSMSWVIGPRNIVSFLSSVNDQKDEAVYSSPKIITNDNSNVNKTITTTTTAAAAAVSNNNKGQQPCAVMTASITTTTLNPFQVRKAGDDERQRLRLLSSAHNNNATTSTTTTKTHTESDAKKKSKKRAVRVMRNPNKTTFHKSGGYELDGTMKGRMHYFSQKKREGLQDLNESSFTANMFRMFPDFGFGFLRGGSCESASTTTTNTTAATNSSPHTSATKGNNNNKNVIAAEANVPGGGDIVCMGKANNNNTSQAIKRKRVQQAQPQPQPSQQEQKPELTATTTKRRKVTTVSSSSSSTMLPKSRSSSLQTTTTKGGQTSGNITDTATSLLLYQEPQSQPQSQQPPQAQQQSSSIFSRVLSGPTTKYNVKQKRKLAAQYEESSAQQFI